MTYRMRIVTFLTLAVLLAGCANNTDMSDVSDIQDSMQVEQTAYQKATEQGTADRRLADRNTADSESVFHAPLQYRTFIYEIWDDDTEPYAVITGVTDAFAECREPLYFCYEKTSEEKDNLVINYAEENGFLPVENIVFGEMNKEPVVRYSFEPLHLTPRVEDFFYGEYADDENFCSFEYAEDATDFGWSEWHAPCGEFEVGEGETHLTASSTLASSDDRYAVNHLLRLPRDDFWNEGVAWAEGAEGTGVGEYIIYNTKESWINSSGRYQDRWSMLWSGGDKDEKGYPADSYGYPYDGYMRYLEVCVVNGYAKNEKTWEENGRVKTLLMYVEDRPYAYLELEDTYKPQYFELPDEDIMAVDGGEISFRFEIMDVYSGSKYEDTCLTGLVLEFSGRFGH